MTLVETVDDAATLASGRPRQPRLPDPDDAVGRRHGGDRRRPAGAASRRSASPRSEDICYATSNRQAAVKAIAAAMRPDAGDRRAQQQQFAAPGRSRRARAASPARLIQRAADIDWDWLGHAGDRRHHRRRLGARSAGARSGRRACASGSTVTEEIGEHDARADDLQAAARARRLMSRAARRSKFSPTARARAIPARAAGAAILRSGGKERELSGGEAPTTNNRMELMAAIEALEGAEEAVPRPALRPTAFMSATASPSGSTAGGATAGGPPTEAGQECRAVAGAARRDRSRTGSNGIGSRATPAIPRMSAPTRWPAPRPKRGARRELERGAKSGGVDARQLGRQRLAADQRCAQQ